MISSSRSTARRRVRSRSHSSRPGATVKDRFSEFVERVERHHERVVVTRNGRPAAVLVSPDDLEALEETVSVLADSDAVRELAEAQAAVAAGDVVHGVDAVRRLRGDG
jgi:antitoxin YefM